MKHRRSKRRRRNRHYRKQSKLLPEPANQRLTKRLEDRRISVSEEQQYTRPTILAHAIRITGFLPTAVLLGMLGTHDYYIHLIPWFQPIVDRQVAILTLSAGNAGLIGLFMGNRARLEWRTLALMAAAIATYLAGHRAIGDNIAGHTLIVILFLSAVLAVFAESIDTGIQWARNFLSSKKGFLTILMVVSVVAIVYNQWQDENYIRNWILIPFGILVGVIIAVAVLWLLLRLGFKNLPTTYSWFKQRVAQVGNWLRKRIRKFRK